MNFILFCILIIMFLKTENILSTLITFMVILFFLEVVFVELLFSKDFSSKSMLFNSLNEVKYSLLMFVGIFYYFNRGLKDDIVFITNFFSVKLIDIPYFFLFMFFLVYKYYFNFVINAGDYHTIIASRNSLDEYAIPVFIIILIMNKGRFLLVTPFFFIALLYAYSGERLKMFMYIFLLFLLFKGNLKILNFKFYIFLGVFFAILLSVIRRGGGESGDLDVHLSHFGELSISSMYLIEYSNGLSVSERGMYLLGLFIGNIVPSSMLTIDMDIKRSLIYFANVPGGGWLPVWFYALGGYPLLIVFSVMFSKLSQIVQKKAHNEKNKKNYFSIVYVVFIIMVNNWFMYTPYQIFKFPIYTLIILSAIYLLLPFKKNNVLS